MGRSSGGGGRSSGGFGGGRSSGGFSGGGRSSRGGFSGGGFGHRNSGSSFGFYHRPMYGGWGPRYYGNGCGCGGGITTILILFILLLFLDFPSGCVILGCAPGCTPGQSSEIYTQTEYTTSTKREPLEGIVSKTDWYEDQLGWISSENVLIEGLEDFYKQTGIQPYVLFVKYSEDLWNDGNLAPTLADEYLEQVYEEKFSDEGHFIFAYFQCANDSKQEMEGEFRYLGGYSTDTIMDNEAIRILWGYFENNYYNTSLTIEEMISNTFSQTGNSIMQNSEKNQSKAPMIISIILISILVIVFIFALVKNKVNKNKGNTGKPPDIIIENNDDSTN